MDDLFARPVTLSDAAGPPSLTHRVPGQAVISQLLQLQRDVPARRRPARIFGVSPLSDETAPWYRGALGERAVGRLLTRLPDGWHVLHAVPVGTAHSEVRRARTVRRAWGMGSVGAGGVAAVTAGPTLLEALLTRLAT